MSIVCTGSYTYVPNNGYGYSVYTFTGNGTITFPSPIFGNLLVVGGGGGGGANNGNNEGAGGGGAGEVGVGNVTFSALTYTVTVGNGGAQTTNGSATTFVSGSYSVISPGGGRGGTSISGYNYTGASGGSGGGATGYGTGGINAGGFNGTGTSTIPGITFYGNNGGSQNVNTAGGGGGGGGGIGASAVGVSIGGNGGFGYLWSVTNSYYGGGGGGGGQAAVTNSGGQGGSGVGGSGGNDNTTNKNGSDGVANTGSGGGGAHGSSASASGGSGGSGVVIVAFLNISVYESNSFINGYLSIKSNFASAGDSTVVGNSIVNGNSTVNGNSIVNGNSTVSQIMSVNSILNINSSSAANTSSTGANGILQITCLPAATSTTGQDGISIKASSNTNGIINFMNTSGIYRGGITGTNSTSVSYVASSDERLKNDIVTMPSQLDNMKTLSARQFTWKSSGIQDFGFIAQEIYRVYPHLNPVLNNDKYEDKLYPKKTDGSDYIHMVDYGKMTPYLWSAVQELTQLVETQQTQIAQMQAQINGLIGTSNPDV